MLTDAGYEAFRRAAPVYGAAIEEHFAAHLSDAERRAVARGLDRVVAANRD